MLLIFSDLSILRLSFEALSQNLNRLTGVTIVYNTLEWQGWSKVETLKCKRVVLRSKLCNASLETLLSPSVRLADAALTPR